MSVFTPTKISDYIRTENTPDEETETPVETPEPTEAK
jgi:hypothetical protein